MKIFSSLRMFALLALGLMVAVSRLEAQAFGLSVTASANPVGVSNSLTYTIIMTNLTGRVTNGHGDQHADRDITPVRHAHGHPGIET